MPFRAAQIQAYRLGLLSLVCGILYGCPYAALFLPLGFPPDDLALIKANSAYIPSQAESDALFAKFYEARRLSEAEPGHNAIAVTFTPIPLALGGSFLCGNRR